MTEMYNDTLAVTSKRFLSPEQCRLIIDLAEDIGFEHGKVRDGSEVREQRTNRTCFLPPDIDQVQHIYQQLWMAMSDANQSTFEFNVLDGQPLQVSKYEGGEFYQWHKDHDLAPREGNHQRKISCSVLLNDSNQYTGGELQFQQLNVDRYKFSEAGDVVFFPSLIPHRVTPVTQGVRYSLVQWFTGPRWV